MSLDVNISEPDEFNCTELHYVIEDVAKLNGIEDFNYHVDCIGGKGESYVANTFRVVINDTENNKNNLKVIVKTLVNTERQETFHELHKREVSVYKVLLPIFSIIQSKIESNNKVTIPECLLSCAEKGKEVLILEDLQDRGWQVDRTLRNYKELDYDLVSLVVKELAQFHSLSYVLKKQNIGEYTEIRDIFKDILYQEDFLINNKLQKYFDESFESSIKLIKDNEARSKMEQVKPKLLDLLRQAVSPGQNSVFCHGDCWINNMLFKYEGNKPIGVCFLDFQAVRYANPVTDIIYFLYLCSSPKFRSEYFGKLKTEYYDTLKSTLIGYDIDINSAYPIEDFMSDIEEKLPYGLLVALIELRVVIQTQEDEAILQSDHIYQSSDFTFLEIRINEVIKESVDNGVLDKLLSEIRS